ncbi:MAG: hypothetical protein NTY38_20620 [Acidobacteria bacterium]|nr:hypothetical protein [Acidobacteriota bacterium]
MQRRDFLGLAAAVFPAADSPFSIQWREGCEYPLGIQDSAFGILDGKVVSAGGFSRHPKDIVRRHPLLFGGGKSGFTNGAFVYDPRHPDQGWTRIADMPGEPRQAAAAVVVGNAMYVIGGFSYTRPWSYTAVYRLTIAGGKWNWENLGADLPWPLCEMGTSVIGSRIYLVGGADFYEPSKDHQDFYITGRGGPPVGNAVLMLDTADLRRGWQRLPDLPGTPRFDNAVAAAGGKIYALSGVYRERDRKSPVTYSNVTDCWLFDPGKSHWSRLPDWPDYSNQRALSYQDRYLILLGSFRYRYTTRPDGSRVDVYSAQDRNKQFKDFFGRTVQVLDTKTGRLSSSEALLDTTCWPMAAIRGGTIYTLGGEGGQRLWHPATFQIGRIHTSRSGA